MAKRVLITGATRGLGVAMCALVLEGGRGGAETHVDEKTQGSLIIRNRGLAI